ncbi:unnamed protein product [Haemonchus placei]|uniref:Arf-GAP domain-containing protein n=1 Tax=Haemonchus placei TaxID=6290 RepID=A0A0N4W4S7_HAEPC|nr:unnamed protein product [Haemonchus placei]
MADGMGRYHEVNDKSATHFCICQTKHANYREVQLAFNSYVKLHTSPKISLMKRTFYGSRQHSPLQQVPDVADGFDDALPPTGDDQAEEVHALFLEHLLLAEGACGDCHLGAHHLSDLSHVSHSYCDNKGFRMDAKAENAVLVI